MGVIKVTVPTKNDLARQNQFMSTEKLDLAHQIDDLAHQIGDLRPRHV